VPSEVGQHLSGCRKLPTIPSRYGISAVKVDALNRAHARHDRSRALLDDATHETSNDESGHPHQALGDDVSRVRDLGCLAPAAERLSGQGLPRLQRHAGGLDPEHVRDRLADWYVLRGPAR